MLRQSPLGRWRMQRDAAHLLIIAVRPQGKPRRGNSARGGMACACMDVLDEH